MKFIPVIRHKKLRQTLQWIGWYCTWFLEEPGLKNLRLETGYPERNCSWFFSDPPGKYKDPSQLMHPSTYFHCSLTSLTSPAMQSELLTEMLNEQTGQNISMSNKKKIQILFTGVWILITASALNVVRIKESKQGTILFNHTKVSLRVPELIFLGHFQSYLQGNKCLNLYQMGNFLLTI